MKKFKRKGERRKGQGEQKERRKKKKKERRKDQVNLEKNNWVTQRKMSQAQRTPGLSAKYTVNNAVKAKWAYIKLLLLLSHFSRV